MQTIQIAKQKYDIISWITGLEDQKLIHKLHQWATTQEHEEIVAPAKGIIPPRRKGNLTEGYGFWADDAPFDETNYRGIDIHPLSK